MRMPRSTVPAIRALPTRSGEVGIVGGLGVVGAEVLDFVAELADVVADFFFQRKAGVVGGDGDFHEFELPLVSVSVV